MASEIFAPNRIDLEKQGFDFRTIRFFEQLGALSSEVVDNEGSLTALLFTGIGQLKSEIYELKKQVENLNNQI